MFEQTNAFIKRHRILRDVTQRELSDTVGIKSVQFISSCERGKCFYPVRRLKQVITKLKLNKQEVIKLMAKDYRTKLHKELL